jgi:hypothetical protein
MNNVSPKNLLKIAAIVVPYTAIIVYLTYRALAG